MNELWFQTDEIGTYRGQCAELCGRDHAFMPIVVEVVSEEDYASWLEERRAAPARAAGAAGGGEDTAPPQWTLETLMAKGEETYMAACVACHQADGQGIPPTFPSLVDSAVVKGDVAEHIDVVLNGRPGTAMQAFGPQLGDDELAAVVTWVRNAWGLDSGDVIEPGDIAAARAGQVSANVGRASARHARAE
jgi:cytochrome c oxidase subunit 2